MERRFLQMFDFSYINPSGTDELGAIIQARNTPVSPMAWFKIITSTIRTRMQFTKDEPKANMV